MTLPNTFDFKLGLLVGAAVWFAGTFAGWLIAQVVIFACEALRHD